jgi:8-oxo-dGTP diphosphatase
MKWVYAIAFEDDRFLMVLNPKRGGWEMPGGRMEKGEDGDTAAKREFREETGQELETAAMMPLGEGGVFTGKLIRTTKAGEMRFELFSELPDNLAFPDCEYREQIAWARKALGNRHGKA